MSKKEPKEVRDAMAIAEGARLAHAESLERTQKLHTEWGDALQRVYQVRKAADEKLAQCRVVEVRRGFEVKDVGLVVIVRQTAGGTLVTRWLGTVGDGGRYTLSKHRSVYVQAEKSQSYSAYRELRDVPEQFFPKEASA